MIRSSVMVLAIVLAVHSFAADSVKITDAAKTKVVKTPSPFMPFIEQPAYKSSWKITIPVEGVDAAQFNGSTTVVVRASEGGSTDFSINYPFSKDPKYTAGKKSVKIVERSIGGIEGRAVLGTTTVKVGKGNIVITIKTGVLPLYAQQYLNFGSLGVVQYPEGPGTDTKTFDLTASVGSNTKTYSGIVYTVKYKNKKKDETYWTGSATGIATAQ